MLSYMILILAQLKVAITMSAGGYCGFDLEIHRIVSRDG